MSLSTVASFFAERWQSTLIDFGSSHWAKCLVGGAVAPLAMVIGGVAVFMLQRDRHRTQEDPLTSAAMSLMVTVPIAACSLDPFPYARRIAGVVGCALSAVILATFTGESP